MTSATEDLDVSSAAHPAGAQSTGVESTPPKTMRAKRADSQRNYDLLLSTAAALFAEHGTEVSLEQIAKGAGVGIGTLYRHFPNRESIVGAAYRRELDQLCAYGEQLLHTHEPDEALLLWMRRFIDYAATKKGMSSVLKTIAATDPDRVASNRALLRGTLEQLVGAAQVAGTVGTDVTSDDLFTGLGGLCMVSDTDGWQARASRMIDLLMAGMRASALR